MSQPDTILRNTVLTSTRYFKRLKLDYPTPDTNRASKRFVKAMKRLDVRACLIYARPHS